MSEKFTNNTGQAIVVDGKRIEPGKSVEVEKLTGAMRLIQQGAGGAATSQAKAEPKAEPKDTAKTETAKTEQKA